MSKNTKTIFMWMTVVVSGLLIYSFLISSKKTVTKSYEVSPQNLTVDSDQPVPDKPTKHSFNAIVSKDNKVARKVSNEDHAETRTRHPHLIVSQNYPPAEQSSDSFPRNSDLVYNQVFAGTEWRSWKGMGVVYIQDISEGQTPDFGNYKIIANSEVSGDLRVFNKEHPVVVYNVQDKTAGILTGVLNIELKSNSSLEYLIEQFDLEVVSAFPSIKRYFVTSKKSVFDLQSLKFYLQNHEQVTDLSLDIMSNNRGRM